LNINMVVGVFDGFLTTSLWHTSNFSMFSPLVAPTCRAVALRRRTKVTVGHTFEKILNPQRDGQMTRLFDRLGEDGRWRSGVKGPAILLAKTFVRG
jgi:hypothetical protein